MSQLTASQKVFYVDIVEEEVSKRYLLPSETHLSKLKTLLRSKGLDIGHHGEAIVTSEQTPNPEGLKLIDTLKSIDSSIDSVYHVTMTGHPVLSNGIARYSSELVQTIDKMEGEDVSTPSTAPVTSTEPLPLAEQIKRQLEAQQAGKPKTLEEAVAEAKQSPAPPIKSAQKAPPESTMDLQTFLSQGPQMIRDQKLDEIHQMVSLLVGMAAQQPQTPLAFTSGQHLQEWIQAQAKVLGYEQVFEELAKRIR